MERQGGGDTSATTTDSSSASRGSDHQQLQKERNPFFRRSLPLPLPSLQAQRAVAERAVKRAKTAQRAVAQRTVKRAKVALGTAMDDLGLTRPPVRCCGDAAAAGAAAGAAAVVVAGCRYG